jgi:hypothetical protein
MVAAIYKVSYVVIGRAHPGTIVNLDHRPVAGEQVKLGEEQFIVAEVIDLMPPRGNFHFIHATCRPLPEGAEG